MEKRDPNMAWAAFAVGSAVFAALTSILAKIGIEGVNSNLATAVRTSVVLLLAWGIVFATGTQAGLSQLSRRCVLFLVLSGLATGCSWLCYYRAIQLGPVSRVAPIDKFSVVLTMLLAFLFLGEKADMKTIAGGVLITAGTLVLIL